MSGPLTYTVPDYRRTLRRDTQTIQEGVRQVTVRVEVNIVMIRTRISPHGDHNDYSWRAHSLPEDALG